jgi:hypothetical protein
MMARSTIAPCKGRIQKRKTTLHLFKSSLQRTAGPYKRAMMYGPGRALQDRSSKTDERESCNNVSGL